MQYSVVDVYFGHINNLLNSLNNREFIQGVIEQDFFISRKEVSKWYSYNKSVQETQSLKLEHKLLLTSGKIASCDTISYLNGFQSRLYTRTFEGSKVHIKEYMLQGYMNPQPAPVYEGSNIKDIASYTKAEENKGQLAGRTIISDWEDDKGIKKQSIIKYNSLEFEYQYDSHNNWVECKEYHDGRFVYLHLRQYKYK